MSFGTVEFRRITPVKPDWDKRVAAKLAALPPSRFTAARDLEVIETVLKGVKAKTLREVDQARVQQLMNAARDGLGYVSLDGQTALLAALRIRAGA